MEAEKTGAAGDRPEHRRTLPPRHKRSAQLPVWNNWHSSVTSNTGHWGHDQGQTLDMATRCDAGWDQRGLQPGAAEGGRADVVRLRADLRNDLEQELAQLLVVVVENADGGLGVDRP
jgi:hypothetical protein